MDARDLTSHVYKEEVAEKVYLTALQLPKELEKVIECLKKIKTSA